MTTTKKKVAKKKATGKAITVTTKIRNPASIEDYFVPGTGELVNPKHELFCHVWVQTFDNEQACNAIGSKWNKDNPRGALDCARAILRREECQLRIRSILAERAKDYAVTDNWIVLELIETYRKCSGLVEAKDSEGNGLGQWTVLDGRSALRALELLGQNLGMFQKQDKTPPTAVYIQMNYGAPPAADPEVKLVPGKKAISGQSKRLN